MIKQQKGGITRGHFPKEARKLWSIHCFKRHYGSNADSKRYEYDGLGRRVGMSSTLSGNTRYGYSGLGLNPIEEVFERGVGLPDDPRGSRNEGRTALKSRESLGRGRYMPYRKNRLTNQERFSQRQTPSISETRSYVYKGRVPAARSAVGDGELRTVAYGHDGLGSIRAVVSHGTVQEQYHYDAFGKPFGDELETDERGYNGKPYDAVLGHYNYGFRDYDPMTGRFATVDPIRDGRNWYVYTANDPVNFIDPWGLAAEDGAAVEIAMNDPLGNAARAKLGEIYEEGTNDCDIWSRNVIKNSGVSDEDNPVKNPEGTTVAGHKKRLGQGQEVPSEGDNLHIRGGHMSLVQKNQEKYTVFHQGTNTVPMKTDTGKEMDYSATYSYSSTETFKKSFWGTGSYYPIKR